ncbi:MAG: hypothetical protein V3T83_16700, partial [Acidobacteriota bacterium]
MPNKGREKVDFYADCNLGIFGLLAPEKTFMGAAVDEKTNVAIRTILSKFSFPSLNVLFSASGRLRSKDENDLKVDTKLDEMEVRVTLRALDPEGNAIPFDKNGTNSPVSVLGLYPFETRVSDAEEPPVQVTPNLPAILEALAPEEPAAPSPGTPAVPASFGFLDLAGVISGLGLVFGGLFKARFSILDKALLAFDK